MGEQSSGKFVWMGDENSPFSGFTDIGSCNRRDCSAVLVSGNQDPGTVLGIIRDFCSPEIPWLVYCSDSNIEQWFDTGAAGFIPVGTSEKTIRATLRGISKLLESASTRNPLSGLPGNISITSRLNSVVLDGHNLVAYFDISGFKPFNDYYGFSRGDAVLRAVASILTENLSG